MGLRFLLGDHLGSSSVTTNASGAKTASALYKAFGETRFTSGTLSTDYKFTGQREESALGGIYFFQSRWFDPYLNRFTQPDSIVPTSTQGTQAWDRYAFVNNNPVRYTDPTGHEAGDSCDRGYEECPVEPITELPVPEQSDGLYSSDQTVSISFYLSGSQVNQLMSILLTGCVDCENYDDYLNAQTGENIGDALEGLIPELLGPVGDALDADQTAEENTASLQSMGLAMSNSYVEGEGYPGMIINVKTPLYNSLGGGSCQRRGCNSVCKCIGKWYWNKLS